MARNMSAPTLPSFSQLPSLPPALRAYLTLAHKLGADVHGQALYGKGWDDAYFVALSAVTFTLARAFSIRCVYQPFAEAWLTPSAAAGHGADAGGAGKRSGAASPRSRQREVRKRKHTALRFAEQAWSLTYCSVFWTLGVVILARIPDRFSPAQLWGTYPYTPLPALTKFYYLAQLGWWFHQVYVLNTEKRRSDHWQMFAHHILTMALLIASYAANYARVGVVVHMLMDFCDIWLPLAKMFRYLDLRAACDATFVVFLVSWFFTRQVGLALVIRTAALDAPKYIPFAWDPARDYYLTPAMYRAFIGLLTTLLGMCTVWLYTALRVALRVVRGQGAEDERSDDEDETGSVGSGKSADALDDVPELATGDVGKATTAPDKMGHGEASGVAAGGASARKRK